MRVTCYCFTQVGFYRGGGTHRLTLHRRPLPAQDVLQLGEVLDESHHLGLEALSMDVLHRGHLQQHFHVELPPEVRIGRPVPEGPEPHQRPPQRSGKRSFAADSLVDVENQRLSSLGGEALSVEITVGGEVAQGQTP